MPVALDCLVGRVGDVTVPLPLLLGARSIDAIFSAASGGEVALNIDTSGVASPPLLQTTTPSTAQLHTAMRRLLNNTARPISKIGLLFTDRFSGDAALLGLMFDVDFNPAGSVDARIPREGCVVFLGKILERNGGSNPAFVREAVYTAVHELGHVFNLGHLPAPENFMEGSPRTSFPTTLDFVTDQRNLLRQSALEFIRPGGSGYGKLGPLQGVGDYSVQNLASVDKFALRLSIDILQREFWYFEPVELDVTLALAPGIHRPVTVPNVVDPAYDEFEIWIDEPDGSRRKYQPTKRFCTPGSTRTITRDEPFSRDVSIFGGAGGFTFSAAGIHRLQARLRLPDGGILDSNVLEVNLLPVRFDDAVFDDFSAFLSDSCNARFLFYRPAIEDPKAAAPMARFAKRHYRHPAAAGVEYAVGRSFLAAAHGAVRRERDLRRRGAQHLERSLEQGTLSRHRRDIAERLLRNET